MMVTVTVRNDGDGADDDADGGVGGWVGGWVGGGKAH